MNVAGVTLAQKTPQFHASFKAEATKSGDVKAGYDELDKLSAKNIYPENSAITGNGQKKKSGIGKWITALIVLLAVGTYYYKRKGKVPPAVVEEATKAMKK